jgi:hypothetical protein
MEGLGVDVMPKRESVHEEPRWVVYAFEQAVRAAAESDTDYAVVLIPAAR